MQLDVANERVVMKSPLLTREGFAHAFFTRRGGVSPAPWGPLNFAVSVGDAREHVLQNLAVAARALGVDPSSLYFLSQVHGTASVVLRGDEDRDEVVKQEGDATLSSAPGVACGVRSADCVPVLVGDRRSGAVLAIHSGWRGTTLDVVAASIRALRAHVGDDGDLVASIGPHIEACCFEVGVDVAEQLARASTLGSAAIVTRGDGARPHVDLRRVVRAQLEATGVADARIDDVRGCTVCDAEAFHSYRRDRERSGRLLSAIVARAAGS